ncbi:MAG: hypothetical protein ACRDY2_02880 [Acidimicrobiales bacterium]
MSITDEALAAQPAIQPPVGTDPDWAEKVALATRERLAAAERWKGKPPTAPQTWPIILRHG